MSLIIAFSVLVNYSVIKFPKVQLIILHDLWHLVRLKILKIHVFRFGKLYVQPVQVQYVGTL